MRLRNRSAPAGDDGATGSIGVLPVLAWEPGTSTCFLVLEREFVAGYSIRLLVYDADLASATDVLAFPSLAGAKVGPVRKKLLVDFADLGPAMARERRERDLGA